MLGKLGSLVASRRVAAPLLLVAVIAAGCVAPPTGRFADVKFEVDRTDDITFAHVTDEHGLPETLRLDMFRPAGAEGPRPAIVFIHSGAFTGGYRMEQDDLAAEFAARGYITVTIDYRLKEGQWIWFNTPSDIVLTAARDARHDAQAAVRFLRAHADDYGIDPGILRRIALEIQELLAMGTQTAVVLGGGNIFRGAGLARAGMDRVTGDQMGMLATVMNCLAMQDALEGLGCHARVMSAIRINEVCEDYIRRRAIRHLEKGRVVLFAAGTGNPFFTTDTAASLRAIEIGADLLLKGTKVNGIYSDDPVKNPAAVHYPKLNFDRVLDERLNVMDATAIVMCRDNNLPLRVFNLNNPGDLLRIARGEDVGTVVTNN